MSTPDVLYTRQWDSDTRLPRPGFDWLDEAAAREVYDARREFLCVVDARERLDDGRPRPRWFVGASETGGFRCGFFTAAGTLDRLIDYAPRDGRLWREVTVDYRYPDDERYYVDGVESLGHTIARFEPSGDGTVLYVENGNPIGEEVPMHDVPVTGFWLDRPEFGDWSRLSDPMYGVPTEADVARHHARRWS